MKKATSVNLFTGFFSLATLIGVQVAHADEVRIECAARIEASAIRITLASSEWSAFVPVGLALHSAGPMDGPPSVMAVLRETSSVSRHGKTTSTWRWEAASANAYPDGKWMACNYGAGNEVIVSKRIPDDTRSCVVTTSKDSLGKTAIGIRCTS
jgi:hypothetical protein